MRLMTDDTPTDGECRARPMAANAVGMVALCRCCGHVHLNLQYVTLRFEAEAFRELVQLMAEGQLRMDGLVRRPPRGADADAMH
jgi:hypothetical protein